MRNYLNSSQNTYFHGNRTNSYSNRNRNQRTNSLRNRSNEPSMYHAIHTHFDNINLLANIVQNSQRLLEHSGLDWNPQRTTNSPSQQIFLIDTSNMNTPNTNTSNSTINIQYLSYEIANVDSSDQSVFDQSNVNIFDVSQYSYISSPLNDTCPITRDAFTPTQNVFMIASCKHIFNKNALRTWLFNNNTCPSCRCTIRNSSQEV